VVRISYPGWAGFVAILLAFTKKTKMEPENASLEKQEASTHHQFWGSMLIFGSVACDFKSVTTAGECHCEVCSLERFSQQKKPGGIPWNSWCVDEKYCEQNDISRCGSKMVCGFKAGFVLSFLKCLFHKCHFRVTLGNIQILPES